MSDKDEVDKIITEFGTTVTVLSYTFSAEADEWAEPVKSLSSTRDIKAVKDRDMVRQLSLLSAGRVNASSASLIVHADEVFDIKLDKFQYGGQDYNILGIQELELSEVLLAQIVEIGLAT